MFGLTRPGKQARAGCYDFGGAEEVSYRFGSIASVTPTRRRAPSPRILYFGAEWCGHCRDVVAKTFPALAASGWSIGDATCHIEICDPESTTYAINGLPAWLLISGGKVQQQMTGFRDQHQVAKWFNDFVEAKQRNAEAAQAPTPYSKIAEALELSGIKPGQTFVDIGCGDGRALIVAAEQFHTSLATGIEMDAELVEAARRRVRLAGLDDRIKIIHGDATELALPTGDVAYVYLYADMLAALKPHLQNFGTVISYLHEVPGLPMRKRGDFYIWHSGAAAVNSAAQSQWRQVYVAPWQTPGRECGNRACVMCYGGYTWKQSR